MKRRITGILAALMVVILAAAPVLAETYNGSDDMSVTYTTDNKLTSTFKKGDLDKPLSALQPGDTAVFVITLKNENAETTDWWMNNAIIRSLEDSSSKASGGAYGYVLTYSGPGGDSTLYSSSVVGGEYVSAAGEGLHEATDALMEDFYLDTLKTGQTATIRLEVSLDGETQGNNYQDTLADLSMEFAVEVQTAVPTVTPTPKPKKSINTGDSVTLAPYVTLMAVGIVVLILAVALLRKRRREAA